MAKHPRTPYKDQTTKETITDLVETFAVGETITDDQNLKSLLDDMDITYLVMDMEQEFDIELDEDELIGLEEITLLDLVKAVDKKIPS